MLNFNEVTVSLPLRLASRLPAGEINREMEFVEILRLIAESFGLPVRCSKLHESALLHIESDWDGQTHIEKLTGATLLQGTFSPETKKMFFRMGVFLEQIQRMVPVDF